MLKISKKLFFLLILTFCIVVGKFTAQAVTLEELMSLREEIAQEKKELADTERSLTAVKSVFSGLPSDVVALTKEEFEKKITLPNFSSNHPNFDIQEIYQAFMAVLPTIADQKEKLKLEKSYYAYKIAYLEKRQEEKKQEWEKKISTFNAERSKLIQQEAVTEIQKRGMITGEPAKITQIHPNSGYAEQIIFIKGNTCPIVAKVFRDVEQYRKEYTQYSEEELYVKMVNEFRGKCDKKLPVLVSFKGGMINSEDKGVLFFSKAKGKPLSQIRNEIPEMDDSRIISIFTDIGQQLGHLDALFYQNKAGQQLRHPDPNSNNIFYNEKEKQAYWIDYGGLALKPYQNSLIRYSGSSVRVVPFLSGYTPLTISSDEEESEKDANAIQKRLLAFHSSYMAYAEEMKKVGVSMDKEYTLFIKAITPIINDLNIKSEKAGMKGKIDLKNIEME